MFRGVFHKKKEVDGKVIEEKVFHPNWAASIFFRETLGKVGRSHLPVFTYPEILEWAREKAKHDPKYKRIFKAKRYVSVKKREAAQRSCCVKRQLRKCFACSTLVEMSDGRTLVVPSRAHLDSWDESQRKKVENNEKLDLFPLPPCPVEVFKRIGVNVSVEGFCSVSVSAGYTGRNDRKDYVFCNENEIAKIKTIPVLASDPLEPRPWLSWSDCYVKDLEAPDSDFSWLEDRPFFEMVDDGDCHVWLEEA